MKIFYRLKFFAVALIIAAAGFIPAVAYGNNIKQYENRIIKYNLQKSSVDSVQEWIDGEFTHDAGSGSEWYIIALSNHGKYDFSNYKNALNDYLSENEVGFASSRLKYALTYIAIVDKTNPYINKVLGNSIGEQGIMSLVFGLHLLNNGYVSECYSLKGLIDELISLQLSDGGFSVMGEYGDIDVTAMTVQALAIHYNDNPEVKASVNNALSFLSSHQLENGGYSAYGVENPESAAQVVIAVSALNIDISNDNRFIKNGNTVFDGLEKFVLDNGSFCHKEGDASDATATAQVLCASIAYDNIKSGKAPFYIFNDTEIISEETTDKAITTEKTLTETTSITETTVFIEATSGIIDTATTTESNTQKTEPAEVREYKTDSVSFIIISVCVISILICTVLFATKKHKFIVLVIITATAAVALVTSISYENKTETIGSVTISINCNVIKDEDKYYIPKNGIILEKAEIEIKSGDTVYDVFSEACKKNDILFSANSKYIEGINNIYEMDFEKSSGWIYFVNGEPPSVGCGNYKLSDGDEIEWHYTRDLGKDLDMNFEKEYN